MKTHLRILDGPDGERIFAHFTGRADQVPPLCADCNMCADYLCDYPVGNGKTCDRNLCKGHRVCVGLELDYCQGHAAQYAAERKRGEAPNPLDMKEVQVRWMGMFAEKIRPKVINLKRYKSVDEMDVYIGRASSRSVQGRYGNPIRFSRTCPICQGLHHDSQEGRKALLKCYRKHIWKEIQTSAALRQEIRDFAYKTLGCFCAPLGCHGDVLADLCVWLWSPEGLSRFPLDIEAGEKTE